MKNLYLRRFLIPVVLFTVIGISAPGCATEGDTAMQPISPAEAQQLSYDATVYGFPLVIMDITRQVFTAVPKPMENGAPVNQFGNKKIIPDATFIQVTRPNADTLYSSTWVDTAEEPVIFSVPDTKGHYYMMPLLNYWTDVSASPGSRTTGTGAGNFAITGPEWKGELPAGVTEIKSQTRWIWIIGRFACAGSSDQENVNKLQDQLKLMPLSAWGTDYVPPADVPVDPGVNRRVSPLDQLLAMDASTYLNNICQLMVENPPYKADEPVLKSVARIGIKPGADYQAYFAALDDDVKAAIQEGYKSALAKIPQTKMGEEKNGWELVYDTGDYGTNYIFRATVAYMGLGANLGEDAFYESSYHDGNGNKYSSDNKYVLHFDKDEIPPINGFWSLTMYNDKALFAANPINRYTIGSLSDPPLVTNTDGSIDIYIQRDSPDAARKANWLPAPASGGFSLALRLYWPKQQVLDKSWVSPVVQMVQ